MININKLQKLFKKNLAIQNKKKDNYYKSKTWTQNSDMP